MQPDRPTLILPIRGRLTGFFAVLLTILAVGSASIFVVLLSSDLSDSERREKDAKNYATSNTKSAAEDISKILRPAVKETIKVKNFLQEDASDFFAATDLLESVISNNKSFYGGSITLLPGHTLVSEPCLMPVEHFDVAQDVRETIGTVDVNSCVRYAIYYQWGEKHVVESRLDDAANYAAPFAEWFWAPLVYGGTWSSPYYCPEGKTTMVTYSEPFINETTGLAGVVTIDISMDELKKALDVLTFGDSGYGAIVAGNLKYYYHPTHKYIGQTLLDVAEERNDEDRVTLADKIRGNDKERTPIEHTSTTTGLDSWLVWHPIATTPRNSTEEDECANAEECWHLTNTFIRKNLEISQGAGDLDEIRQQRIMQIIALVVAVIMMSLLMLILKHDSTLWVGAWIFIASAGIIIGTGFTWSVALEFPTQNFKFGREMINTTSISEEINEQFKNLKTNVELSAKITNPPQKLQTGLQLSTVQFTAANEVTVSGQIWHRYEQPQNPTKNCCNLCKNHSNSSPPDSPKVLFAGAIESKFFGANTKLGGTIHAWQFSARLPQQFHFFKYPLEQETIQIALLPKSPDENVVVVPDIEGYKMMLPSDKPGLSSRFLVPGWEIEKTNFQNRPSESRITAGFRSPFSRFEPRECVYSITMKRQLIHTFISRLVPLIVVAVLLFIFMLTSTKDPERLKIVNAGTGRVLSSCSALFFVVVFSHIGMRQDLPGGEIFYLEWFYFVLYFSILVVALNSILYSMGSGLKRLEAVIEYKNNLIPKLIFWPGLLGTLFVVTLLYFY